MTKNQLNQVLNRSLNHKRYIIRKKNKHVFDKELRKMKRKENQRGMLVIDFLNLDAFESQFFSPYLIGSDFLAQVPHDSQSWAKIRMIRQNYL